MLSTNRLFSGLTCTFACKKKFGEPHYLQTADAVCQKSSSRDFFDCTFPPSILKNFKNAFTEILEISRISTAVYLT